ncbi:hypothetical protein VCHA53O466_50536 [Vibrio chagasii]|nr:hypothetical protein VCHA53O466_50536 [Vibrio chagasii]
MNAKEALLRADFNFSEGEDCDIHHDGGCISLSVTNYGVLRADGYNTSGALVCIVVLSKKPITGEWQVSTKEMDKDVLTKRQSATEFVNSLTPDKVINIGLCFALFKELLRITPIEALDLYHHRCTILSKEAKEQAMHKNSAESQLRRAEIMKTHRLITEHEITKTMKQMKAQALSSSSTSYINFTRDTGEPLSLGCSASLKRVTWYINYKRSSVHSIISELKSSCMIHLPELT